MLIVQWRGGRRRREAAAAVSALRPHPTTHQRDILPTYHFTACNRSLFTTSVFPQQTFIYSTVCQERLLRALITISSFNNSFIVFLGKTDVPSVYPVLFYSKPKKLFRRHYLQSLTAKFVANAEFYLNILTEHISVYFSFPYFFYFILIKQGQFGNSEVFEGTQSRLLLIMKNKTDSSLFGV